jgi:hypothetical protein
MTHRNTTTKAGPDGRGIRALLCAFTTALLWWIGVVGVITTGGGALTFLIIPALATVGTIMVERRRRHPSPAPTVQRRRRHRNAALSGGYFPVVILWAFTTALLWWIGIVGVLNAGGAHVFLTVPALATIGTLIITLYHPGETTRKLVPFHSCPNLDREQSVRKLFRRWFLKDTRQ